MKTSNLFSIGNAIRIMILGGLVAVFAVIVQSCQSPKSNLDRFGVKSLKKLQVVEDAPVQPSDVFQTVDGQTLALKDLRGKVVLLNAWATWCAPCVAEMPSLDRLQAARGGGDFEVVTISADRTAAEAAAFFEKYDIDSLTPWHDTSFSLFAKINAPGLPTTVIYNREGREVARLAGEAAWDSPEALALVDYLTSQ